MKVVTQRMGSTGPVLLGAAFLFALMLALPGQTVTTAYVNDLFIFLDGIHRVASGQVPNRDFHTALGPLNFYIPAIGYWISGSMGGALPTGMAVSTLALALPMAHVLRSRLHPIIGISFGLFLLLIVAVPMNLGESIAALSFAMFYNRVGWASLSILVVMYLRPTRTHAGQNVLDALCAAGLTVLMLYLKLTYGLVALVFLAFVAFDASQRRWALGALGLALLSVPAVEAVWQSSRAHLEDLLLAGRVSGSRGIADFAETFVRHWIDYSVLAVFAALTLRRTRSFRDVLFFGFCAGAGLLIQTQNSQAWGIITIQAGAAVAAEILLRSRPNLQDAGWSLRGFGPQLLLLVFLVPTGLTGFAALSLHTALAATRTGEPFGLPEFNRVRLTTLWVPGDRTFITDYLDSIREGARLLGELPVKPQNVSVLDFANPFSAGLNLPPPRGDSAWLHWGRNVNDAHFIAPEQLFRNVDVLMEPKQGINNAPLHVLYGAYIQKAFEPVRETDLWIVHRRREHKAISRAEIPQEHEP
jgi:hypothetical protein